MLDLSKEPRSSHFNSNGYERVVKTILTRGYAQVEIRLYVLRFSDNAKHDVRTLERSRANLIVCADPNDPYFIPIITD